MWRRTGPPVLFTLWILPGLTSALTGIPYRRIVTLIWDPLITSFVTANLFIVLPLIQERSKQLLAEQQPRRASSRRSSTTGSRAKAHSSNGSRAGRSAEMSSAGGDEVQDSGP
jgi:hypothetical protein